MEKKTEQLQAAAEKAAQALQVVSEKLEAAQKALTEKPEDESTAGSPGENKQTGGKKIRLKVRNKTGRPTYYRAGLCFGQVDAEYEVTKDVADILLVDPWLVAGEIK